MRYDLLHHQPMLIIRDQQMQALALDAERRFAQALIEHLGALQESRGLALGGAALAEDVERGLSLMDEFGLVTQSQIARCFEIAYGAGFALRDCPKAALNILLAYRVSPSFKLRRLAAWADEASRTRSVAA